MIRILVVALLACAAGAARAQPLTYALPQETAALKPGVGVKTATSNCLACHSADYILTQPPKKGKAFWQAEVQKMIKVFNAPIEPADAAAITEYLASTY